MSSEPIYPTQKHCKKCDTTKTIEEFHKHKGRSDGRQTKCKECCKVYRKKNAEKNAEYKKWYYEKNRDSLLKYNKEYHKRYYKENRERLLKREKEPDVRSRIVKRNKWRYDNDPIYRISRLIRNRIPKALKRNSKSTSTFDLLGCTIDHLKEHLESQFTEGMTWGNRGDWHIDHIKPCASFDLSDPEQQKACFHWSNLQPLWARDNLTKGCKDEPKP